MTAAREPNIIWTGEGEPPSHYMDGRETVLVPSSADKGFWTPDPMRLMRLSGGAFKLFVQKGEPAINAGAAKGKSNKREKR